MPTRREFDRAVDQTSRIIEPAEHQTGASQGMVGYAELQDPFPRRLTLEKLIALL